MGIFKKTLSALLMMTALVSTSALANKADGDAKVRAAGEATLAKTQEALDLLEKGGDKNEVLKLLSDVRQSQKDFRYEQTERLRQKAGDKMRIAREEIEKGDANGVTNLRATLDYYKEMIKVYNAAH